VIINPIHSTEATMNLTKSPAMLLLGLYLILVGAAQLVTVPIPPVVVGLLALVAGVLILVQR